MLRRHHFQGRWFGDRVNVGDTRGKIAIYSWYVMLHNIYVLMDGYKHGQIRSLWRSGEKTSDQRVWQVNTSGRGKHSNRLTDLDIEVLDVLWCAVKLLPAGSLSDSYQRVSVDILAIGKGKDAHWTGVGSRLFEVIYKLTFRQPALIVSSIGQPNQHL